MTSQLNLRLPYPLLHSARAYTKEYGYANVQDFITELVREKLFEEPSPKELALVNKLVAVSDKHELYGNEKDIFKKLKR